MKELFYDLLDSFRENPLLISLVGSILTTLLGAISKERLKNLFHLLTGCSLATSIWLYSVSIEKEKKEKETTESRLRYIDSVSVDVNRKMYRLQQSADTTQLLSSVVIEKIEETSETTDFQFSLSNEPVNAVRFFFDLPKPVTYQPIEQRLFGDLFTYFPGLRINVNLASLQDKITLQFIPGQNAVNSFTQVFYAKEQISTPDIAIAWSELFFQSNSLCEFSYQFVNRSDSSVSIYSERQIYEDLKNNRILFLLNISGIEANELQMAKIYNEILDRIPSITVCIDVGGRRPCFVTAELEPVEGHIDPGGKSIRLGWELNSIPARHYFDQSPFPVSEDI